MKGFPQAAATLAVLFFSAAVFAIEPDEVRIRVSVKRVLSPSGALPTGNYGSTTEIQRVIGKCNDALGRSGAAWTLVLAEVVNTQAASGFYSMSSSEMGTLETNAKGNAAGYAWREDAINMYVVDEITDAGGVCSFPAFGISREVITINSRGILGGSEGWLHEIGHYFNLIHPHEGDQVADTIFDPPLPSPFDCALHDQNLLDSAVQAGASAADTYNGLHNIMGYHCDPLILTPLQVVRVRRALLDYRLKVMEPIPPDAPPVAEIRLPPEAAGGVVAFTGVPVTVDLDGSHSTDGDGGTGLTAALTFRWAVISGPAGGAGFDTPATGWLRGCSGIGYGDDDDLTELSDMRNRYLAAYATRAFDVPDPSRFRTLELDIAYDDGFAAFLNGTEVARHNLASGAGPNTPAEASEDGRLLLDLTSFLNLLVTGRNRFSIEIHNSSLDSSDLSLHPVLSATGSTGAVTALIPSRAVWYYRKGSAGEPPAGWGDPGFDAGAARAKVVFTLPGVYRIRLTADDSQPPDSTGEVEVELTVGAGFFTRGDCNRDGTVDISDAVRNLLHLFGGGPASTCPDACDANDDETEDVSDSIALLHYLFTSGPPPAPPFPVAGVDPAGEALECGG